eukprot:37821_1
MHSTFSLQYIDHYAKIQNKGTNDIQSRMCFKKIPPPPSGANSISFILLYTSHFLQRFGDRLWQFAVPLLLTELFINTLFPQALMKFCNHAAVFIVMPFFGAWIDTSNRLYVVTTTIWVQNLCICISSSLMCILAYYHQDIIESNTINYKLILTFGGILITTMIGQITGKGVTLSLERDWVVILCTSFNNTTNNKLLTNINGRMTQIDLFCKIIPPAFFGIYTQYLGDTSISKVYYGTIVIFAWNVIGLVLEWICIQLLYDKNKNSLSITNKRGKKAKTNNAFVVIKNGYKSYMLSSIFFGSLSGAMLCTSILTGGVLVTAYLKFRGISYLVLGVTKGCGAIFGIFGTIIEPYLKNNLGLTLELIGLITIICYWFTLLPVGIGDIIVGDHKISIAYLMLICMMVSRCSLWAFDLAFKQLMQVKVNPIFRGQINGTQSAICQIFYMMSSVLTMIFHTVDQFFILVWVTLIVTLFACVVYFLWYFIPWCQIDRYVTEEEQQVDK